MTRAADDPNTDSVPGDMLCFAIYAAAHAFTKAYRPILARAGLTYPQFLAMTLLWRRDGRSVGEIAGPLFLDSGTLTPLLKRLKSAGWVTSERDGRDERQVRVWLTAAGRALEAELAGVSAAIGCATELTPEEATALSRRLLALGTTLRQTGRTREGAASKGAAPKGSARTARRGAARGDASGGPE